MSRTEAAMNFFNEAIDAIPGSPGEISTIMFNNLKEELADYIGGMLEESADRGGNWSFFAQNKFDVIFNTIDEFVADPTARAEVAKLSAQTIGSGGRLDELRPNSVTARLAWGAALNEPLQEQNGRFELPGRENEEGPGAGGEIDPGENDGHELDPQVPVPEPLPEPLEPGVPVEPPVEPFDPAAEGRAEGPPGGLPFE
jgi:hypothetical protein